MPNATLASFDYDSRSHRRFREGYAKEAEIECAVRVVCSLVDMKMRLRLWFHKVKVPYEAHQAGGRVYSIRGMALGKQVGSAIAGAARKQG